ncbi:MAG: MerR family transcriptional regulator [Solirubrobacterales bacterium]
MTEVTESTMTIDELARRTGMTVRNIRAHQSRGLLPPPEVRGRTGYYDEGHATRIELIRDLQAEGLNLEAIRRLLDGVGESSEAVLDFTRTLKTPFEDEEPEVVHITELAEGVADPNPELLARAERLGLFRPLGGGRYEVVSPRLRRARLELAELGIGPEAALEVVEEMHRHARGVARSFVRLFVKNVWEPFEEAGRPEEGWPGIRDALERLRPLATESLLAVFKIAMTEETDKAVARTLQRDSEGSSRSSGRRSKRRR